jgi:hypothetical protein
VNVKLQCMQEEAKVVYLEVLAWIVTRSPLQTCLIDGLGMYQVPLSKYL